jgi:hypothetical protein
LHNRKDAAMAKGEEKKKGGTKEKQCDGLSIKNGGRR